MSHTERGRAVRETEGRKEIIADYEKYNERLDIIARKEKTK